MKGGSRGGGQGQGPPVVVHPYLVKAPSIHPSLLACLDRHALETQSVLQCPDWSHPLVQEARVPVDLLGAASGAPAGISVPMSATKHEKLEAKRRSGQSISKSSRPVVLSTNHEDDVALRKQREKRATTVAATRLRVARENRTRHGTLKAFISNKKKEESKEAIARVSPSSTREDN